MPARLARPCHLSGTLHTRSAEPNRHQRRLSPFLSSPPSDCHLTSFLSPHPLSYPIPSNPILSYSILFYSTLLYSTFYSILLSVHSCNKQQAGSVVLCQSVPAHPSFLSFSHLPRLPVHFPLSTVHCPLSIIAESGVQNSESKTIASNRQSPLCDSFSPDSWSQVLRF